MSERTSRAEHIKWCKKRAYEYLERHDYQNAINSMVSDLGKHPETEKLQRMSGELTLALFLGGGLTYKAVKDFIDGFN